jgi:hypothetical protein
MLAAAETRSVEHMHATCHILERDTHLAAALVNLIVLDSLE